MKESAVAGRSASDEEARDASDEASVDGAGAFPGRCVSCAADVARECFAEKVGTPGSFLSSEGDNSE